MIDFLLFLLAGVGITNIMVNASILDNLRDFVTQRSSFLGKLFNCMLCTGFWVGFILAILMPTTFGSFGVIAPICAGAIISLFSSFYDIITDYILFISE